jgi:hypothetical protein
VSRRGLALAGALIVALMGGFVALVIVSFNIVHGDRTRGGTKASTLPPVTITGAQQTVFDWSKEGCSGYDYPDLPARAYRDAQGQIQLIASHFVNRRMSGPSLNRLRHSCDIVLASNKDGDPTRFDDLQWIAATYTPDGRTVHALLHQEYQGSRHPNACPSGVYLKCWHNSITYAVSKDGGRSFSQPPPARQLVAALPYRYVPDVGPVGLFTPSNIVRNPRDDLYYALIRTEKYRSQKPGACLMRTGNLGDPRSWRAWDGDGFGVRFANPYPRRLADPSDHICAPVSPKEVSFMSSSLTWSTYYDKWLLVAAAGQWDPRRREVVFGIYYSLSDDLIEWEPRKLIREAELTWSYRCGDSNPIMYPAVLDPQSKSRNFETVGRTAWLYFTRNHYKDCKQTSNRDLVRVPIEFK